MRSWHQLRHFQHHEPTLVYSRRLLLELVVAFSYDLFRGCSKPLVCFLSEGVWRITAHLVIPVLRACGLCLDITRMGFVCLWSYCFWRFARFGLD